MPSWLVHWYIQFLIFGWACGYWKCFYNTSFWLSTCILWNLSMFNLHLTKELFPLFVKLFYFWNAFIFCIFKISSLKKKLYMLAPFSFQYFYFYLFLFHSFCMIFSPANANMPWLFKYNKNWSFLTSNNVVRQRISS